jgi:hypothetical protein
MSCLEAKPSRKKGWGVVTDSAILAARARAERGSADWIEAQHREIVTQASRDRRREPIPQ